MGILAAGHYPQNLWPDSPPTAYLALEAILNGTYMFGPMLASLIVLKRRLQGHLLLSLFRQERDLALLANLWWRSDRLLCPSFWRQAGRRRFSKLSLVFIYCIVLSGRDWRRIRLARLPTAGLEKKFSFFVSALMTSIIWAIWHIPLWFYDRFLWSKPWSFSVFIIFSIFLSFWLAALL